MTPWDENPRALIALSFATAVSVVIFALLAIGRHAGYNVAAAMLALMAFLFGHRAWQMAVRRRLDSLQCAQLLTQLRQVSPVSVRVTSINSLEAIVFARQILEVFRQAGWPATGVYRATHRRGGAAGLLVAVADVATSPAEAQHVVNALAALGLTAPIVANPRLPGRDMIEIFVGTRGTA